MRSDNPFWIMRPFNTLFLLMSAFFLALLILAPYMALVTSGFALADRLRAKRRDKQGKIFIPPGGLRAGGGDRILETTRK